MMESLERKSSKPMLAMLMPSISISPDESPTNLNRHMPNEDLPEPVRPTIPAET